MHLSVQLDLSHFELLQTHCIALHQNIDWTFCALELLLLLVTLNNTSVATDYQHRRKPQEKLFCFWCISESSAFSNPVRWIQPQNYFSFKLLLLQTFPHNHTLHKQFLHSRPLDLKWHSGLSCCRRVKDLTRSKKVHFSQLSISCAAV